MGAHGWANWNYKRVIQASKMVRLIFDLTRSRLQITLAWLPKSWSGNQNEYANRTPQYDLPECLWNIWRATWSHQRGHNESQLRQWKIWMHIKTIESLDICQIIRFTNRSRKQELHFTSKCLQKNAIRFGQKFNMECRGYMDINS
jgi:hypothetical protein